MGRYDFIRKSAAIACLVSGLMFGVAVVVVGFLNGAVWVMAVGLVIVLLGFVAGGALSRKGNREL